MNAALFTGLAALVPVSFFADAPVQAWVLAHQSESAILAGKMASRFLAWHWLMLGCAIGVVVCALRKKSSAMQLIIIAMICSSLAGLAADATRGLTGRTRPNSGLEAGWFGVRRDGKWLLGDARYHAFPSGHTAAATALAAAFIFARSRSGWAFAPLPLVVGAARIYIGAHHFSDVIAGMALGITTAFLVHRGAAHSKAVILSEAKAEQSETPRKHGANH